MRDRKSLCLGLKRAVVKVGRLVSFLKGLEGRKQKKEEHFLQGVGFQSTEVGAS